MAELKRISENESAAPVNAATSSLMRWSGLSTSVPVCHVAMPASARRTPFPRGTLRERRDGRPTGERVRRRDESVEAVRREGEPTTRKECILLAVHERAIRRAYQTPNPKKQSIATGKETEGRGCDRPPPNRRTWMR